MCPWFCLVSALWDAPFWEKPSSVCCGVPFSGCCLCRPARLRRRSAAGGPVCGYHMGRRIGAFVYAGFVQRRHRFLDDVDQSAAPASVGRCCNRCDRPCGNPVGLACVWLCRCRFVRSCHNGGYLAGYRQNYVRQQCRQNADDHHYQGQEIADEISRQC